MSALIRQTVRAVLVATLGSCLTLAGYADDTANPRVKVWSGVEYQDLAIGEGTSVRMGETVTVHATGWLANGEKFWSSIDDGQTYDFILRGDGVISGWIDGIPGMKVGGRRKLWIPSELAYGKRGNPPLVPPHSDLVFEIELFAIKQSAPRAN